MANILTLFERTTAQLTESPDFERLMREICREGAPEPSAARIYAAVNEALMLEEPCDDDDMLLGLALRCKGDAWADLKEKLDIPPSDRHNVRISQPVDEARWRRVLRSTRGIEALRIHVAAESAAIDLSPLFAIIRDELHELRSLDVDFGMGTYGWRTGMPVPTMSFSPRLDSIGIHITEPPLDLADWFAFRGKWPPRLRLECCSTGEVTDELLTRIWGQSESPPTELVLKCMVVPEGASPSVPDQVLRAVDTFRYLCRDECIGRLMPRIAEAWTGRGAKTLDIFGTFTLPMVDELVAAFGTSMPELSLLVRTDGCDTLAAILEALCDGRLVLSGLGDEIFEWDHNPRGERLRSVCDLMARVPLRSLVMAWLGKPTKQFFRAAARNHHLRALGELTNAYHPCSYRQISRLRKQLSLSNFTLNELVAIPDYEICPREAKALAKINRARHRMYKQWRAWQTVGAGILRAQERRVAGGSWAGGWNLLPARCVSIIESFFADCGPLRVVLDRSRWFEN